MKYAKTQEGEEFARLILRATIGRGAKSLVAVAATLFEELDSGKQEDLRDRVKKIVDESNAEYEPGQ